MGKYYVAGIPFDSENSLKHYGVKGMEWNKHKFGIDADDRYIKWLKNTGQNIGNFATKTAQNVANATTNAARTVGSAVNKGANFVTGTARNTARNVGNYVDKNITGNTARKNAQMYTNTANNPRIDSVQKVMNQRAAEQAQAQANNTLAGRASNAANAASSWAGNAAKNVGKTVSTAANQAGDWAKNAASKAADVALWPATKQGVANTAKNVGNAVAGAANQAGQAIGNAAQNVGNFVDRNITGNSDRAAANAYRGIAKDNPHDQVAAKRFEEVAQKAQERADNSLFGRVGNAANAVGNAVGGAFNDAKNWAGQTAQNAGHLLSNQDEKEAMERAQEAADRQYMLSVARSGYELPTADGGADQYVGRLRDSMDIDAADRKAAQARQAYENHPMTKLQNAAQNVGDTVSGAINSAGQAVGNAAQNVASGAKGAINSAGQWVADTSKNVGNAVGNAANSAKKGVSGFINSAGQWVSNTANNVGNAVGNAANAAGNAVGGAFNDAKNWAGDRAQDVGNFVDRNITGNSARQKAAIMDQVNDDVAGKIDYGLFQQRQNEIDALNRQADNTLFGRVGNAVGGAANAVGDWAGNAAKDVGNAVGGAAQNVGTWAGNAAKDVGNAVTGTANAVGDWAGQAAKDVGGAVQNAGQSVANIPQNIANWYTGNDAREEAQRQRELGNLNQQYGNALMDAARNGNWNSEENQLGAWDEGMRNYLEGGGQLRAADQYMDMYNNAPRQRIASGLQNAANAVGQAAQNVGGAVSGAANAVGDWVGDRVTDARDAITAPARQNEWDQLTARNQAIRDENERKFNELGGWDGSGIHAYNPNSGYMLENDLQKSWGQYLNNVRDINQHPVSSAVNYAAGNVADWARNAAGNVGNTVSGAAGQVGDWARNAAGNVGNWAGQAAQNVGNVASQAGQWAGNAAQNVGNFVSELANPHYQLNTEKMKADYQQYLQDHPENLVSPGHEQWLKEQIIRENIIPEQLIRERMIHSALSTEKPDGVSDAFWERFVADGGTREEYERDWR